MQNLQNTITWSAPFINYQPQSIGGLEPALTNGNIILSTMLGPPFSWRFNRGELTFNTIQAVTDYAQLAPDFGFVEKAWLTINGVSSEIAVKSVLGIGKEQARPAVISVHKEDDAGNVTFRLMGAPDAVYAVTVQYQKKPVLMSSLASVWSPIPDAFAYIYEWGFLAMAAMFTDDPRFPIFNQKFVSHLLGAQEGLDETQRNIFLGKWLEITKEVERAQGKTNQGIAARQK